MPLPVISESNGNGEAAPEEEPRLEFTYVESLMYAFHQLARQSADFLAGNADRLKDFRLRYLIRRVHFSTVHIEHVLLCSLQPAVFRTRCSGLHEEAARVASRKKRRRIEG